MRPDQIGVWLKNGRKLHAPPDIHKCVKEFGEAWLVWWMDLQPKWRGKWPNLSYDMPDWGLWQQMQKVGPNGFFLVLLSFAWWGSGVLTDDGKKIEPHYSDWLHAFTDIQWVLDHVVDDLDHTRKQDHEEDTDEDADSSKPLKRLVFLTLFRICQILAE